MGVGAPGRQAWMGDPLTGRRQGVGGRKRLGWRGRRSSDRYGSGAGAGAPRSYSLGTLTVPLLTPVPLAAALVVLLARPALLAFPP